MHTSKNFQLRVEDFISKETFFSSVEIEIGYQIGYTFPDVNLGFRVHKLAKYI